MANTMWGSICLEDLFAGRTITGKDGKQYACISDIQGGPFQTGKNGKHYAGVNLYIGDEPDQYGNSGSLSLSQTKEEREAGQRRTYIGNLKWSQQQPQQQPQAEPVSQAPAGPVPIPGDLPF